MRTKFDTAEEKISKATTIAHACEVFQRQLTDQSLRFMVESLDRFSAKAVREAAKILVTEKNYFSINSLVDIIYEFKLFEDDDDQSDVIQMTREEHEEWRNEIERQEMGMTKEEWDQYLIECDEFWKDKPALGWDSCQ